MIGNNYIGLAVLIEICNGHCLRRWPNRVISSWLESAIAVSQQNAHDRIAGTGDDEIRNVVIVEPTGSYRYTE